MNDVSWVGEFLLELHELDHPFSHLILHYHPLFAPAARSSVAMPSTRFYNRSQTPEKTMRPMNL